MMLTAVNDAPTATEALAHGAMDYLMKPIELGDLATAVERVLHKRDLSIEQRKVERLIREEVAAQTEELGRERKMLHETVVDVVKALVQRAGGQGSLPPRPLRPRRRPRRVHRHHGPQRRRSREHAPRRPRHGRGQDRHPRVGAQQARRPHPGGVRPREANTCDLSLDILSSIRPIAHILPAVRDHHEHWDGNGYPRGIKGEDIDLGGRILAAADAFDALTSRRAWRDPLTPPDAIQFLHERSGTLLDPIVFDCPPVRGHPPQDAPVPGFRARVDPPPCRPSDLTRAGPGNLNETAGRVNPLMISRPFLLARAAAPAAARPLARAGPRIRFG
jgi:putative two-component system response regulator